ncbi:aldehyde dehydrogenase [Jeotgalicoccus huakuii]|uniref:aldehyde dehydrogenase n=1 Tax=Jeotgalicoccus marinus TaxID=516700 RepID=UPI0003F69469|nr:aldehyde dehydrogenase [Jeotgalicoccus marinus]MCK1976477.1 aldehyde dehydrogenase [Jeotgalicoccus huakuii]
MSVEALVLEQRKYFLNDYTRPVDFRVRQLRKLRTALKANEKIILDALYEDLGKSSTEAYMTELGIIYQEINYAIKHVKKWASPKKVKSSVMSLPASSHIYAEPYGVTLILSPWNYPVNLTIGPLIGAIAAGNCAVVKPSETSPKTSAILEKIINYTFVEEFVHCLPYDTPHDEVNKQDYDYIFFTGSTRIGKEIMSIASQTLTPVTLELGGKSPAIIDETANIDVAARRIAWGKFINAGQTCVAPDHLIIHESIKDAFIERLIDEINERYEDAESRDDYPKIINNKHFERLTALLDDPKLIGGRVNVKETKIAPAILPDSYLNDDVMAEEIFGPILPILTYDNIDDLIVQQQALPKPLATYIFTEDNNTANLLLQKLSFGGGCVNDTLMHLASHSLPFGGVGASGMGAYHGKASFDTFSHFKSVVKNTTAVDFPVRYAPFDQAKSKLFKRLLG